MLPGLLPPAGLIRMELRMMLPSEEEQHKSSEPGAKRVQLGLSSTAVQLLPYICCDSQVQLAKTNAHLDS